MQVFMNQGLTDQGDAEPRCRAGCGGEGIGGWRVGQCGDPERGETQNT